MSDPEIDLSSPYVPHGSVPGVGIAPPAYEPLLRPMQSPSAEAIRALVEQGFPRGLAQEMVGNARQAYPRRYWVIDNSGSMRSNDGSQIRGSKDAIRVDPCSRWTELQGTAEYHIQLAGLLQSPTIFRLLNDPGASVGPQTFVVADPANPTLDSIGEVQRAVQTIKKSQPAGVTPLTFHVHDIEMNIRQIEPLLKQSGQKVAVVLATDGLPSDDSGESTQVAKDAFIAALKSLQRLPVWLVIRLCTNDDLVVDYYNDLDKSLELPFEVLDDYLGEAKEIQAVNGWLNYGLPLHRCREMGYHHRIFDLLDERVLSKDELVEFLKLLFGEQVLQKMPDIHADWKGFKKALSRELTQQGSSWNPARRRVGPWIDMQQLERVYGKHSGDCIIL